MTVPYDQISEAWRTGGPTALHGVAEQLAAQGCEESAIYDALEKLLLEERANGADDGTEERIMGVMDRLTGWCHESNHIKATRNTLPTEEEIAKLPRWARTAFAARCARRVLMAGGERWDQIPDSLARIIHEAVSLVELATARRLPIKSTDLQAILEVAFNIGLQVKGVTRNIVDTIYQAVAASAADGGLFEVSKAASTAVLVHRDVGFFVRHDFDHLARLAEWQQWTDDTAVSPDVFGPLWPEGPPAGWPADPYLPQRTELPLSLVIREGTPPSDIPNAALELFHALNNYYIARTGDRLTPEGDIYTYLSALMPAGAT